MPGKNSKQSTKTVTETPVEPAAAPVVEAVKPAATPVVEAAKPAAAPAQKGGKKAVAKTVEAAPVVEVAKAAEKPAVAAAEKPATQKGGKKAAAKTEAVEAAPVVDAAEKPAAKKGAKKAVTKEATDKPAAAQKGGKKAAAPKKAAKQAAEKPAAAQAGGDEEADEESSDRRIRSFKVKLPNREDFEGRFTGLTPYQAANKALSKYFRETEKPLVEITFSICESTRKSRKSVYTYVGKRQKLETPVVYKIQDGREIVKSFKNSLKKVKKSESSASASA
jgi:hypothetical protein